MIARPLAGQPLPNDARYVRDPETGFIWHRVEHRIIYGDTDRSGSVYHANYLRYFEIGRTTLLRDGNYPYSTVEENGYVYPVVETGLKFRRPLHYDELIWIHSRFRDIQYVVVSFEYVITLASSSEVVCDGFTRHCATNGKGQPRRIDPMTRRAFEGFPKS